MGLSVGVAQGRGWATGPVAGRGAFSGITAVLKITDNMAPGGWGEAATVNVADLIAASGVSIKGTALHTTVTVG